MFKCATLKNTFPSTNYRVRIIVSYPQHTRRNKQEFENNSEYRPQAPLSLRTPDIILQYSSQHYFIINKVVHHYFYYKRQKFLLPINPPVIRLNQKIRLWTPRCFSTYFILLLLLLWVFLSVVESFASRLILITNLYRMFYLHPSVVHFRAAKKFKFLPWIYVILYFL